MIKIATAQLWVHDQDEALAFYTEKLGMEVRSDVTLPEMGDFRWLTVGPADQPDFSIVLMAVPGPPVMDSDTRDQVLDLDGVRASPAPSSSPPTTCTPPTRSFKGRGVEFSEAPEERPYGIDSGLPRPVGQLAAPDAGQGRLLAATGRGPAGPRPGLSAYEQPRASCDHHHSHPHVARLRWADGGGARAGGRGSGSRDGMTPIS